MTKRTGRPPLDPDDPSIRVFCSLPSKRYEVLSRTAAVARQTVPEFVRSTLERALSAKKVPPRQTSD